MTWQQTKSVVFSQGPCKGCGAGIVLDGQISQGQYDGRRVAIIPDFHSDRKKKNENCVYCKFCRDPNHPIKQARKRRRDENRQIEEAMMGVSTTSVPTATSAPVLPVKRAKCAPM